MSIAHLPFPEMDVGQMQKREVGWEIRIGQGRGTLLAFNNTGSLPKKSVESGEEFRRHPQATARPKGKNSGTLNVRCPLMGLPSANLAETGDHGLGRPIEIA
jgi:hypothetical protein